MRLQKSNPARILLSRDLKNGLYLVLFGHGILFAGIFLFDAHEAEVRYLYLQKLPSLVLDALLLSITILCSASLLISDESTSFAVRISLFIFLASLWSNIVTERIMPPLQPFRIVTLATVTSSAALLVDIQFSCALKTALSVPKMHFRKIAVFLYFIFMTALWMWYWGFAGLPATSLGVAIEKLHSQATTDAANWAAQAASSKTLSDAVISYKRRYGLPPPPNFHKWHEFATARGSLVIDSFDQIFDDLLPFWGIAPREIRIKTIRAIQESEKNVGGLQIVNGTVKQSPNIPGTHRWMTDALERMIDPFAKSLPDMFIAFNLADECRVSVPYEQLTALEERGQNSVSRLIENSKHDATNELYLEAKSWPESFETMDSMLQGNDVNMLQRPVFMKNAQRQIYHELVASTCPPRSLSRQHHWNDWSKVCSNCILAHSVITKNGPIPRGGGILSDMCHQPDLAGQYGFFMSPFYMEGTRDIHPIFSQAKVRGFSDILVPSPWDFANKSTYDATADMSWTKKHNSLYWRGSSTDGFAKHGMSDGFLRTRFVHEAYQQAKGACQQDQIGCGSINATFVGDVFKCDKQDCQSQRTSFSRWSQMTYPAQAPSNRAGGSHSRLPDAEPFESNWKFRHLMDMDGAGFSGRFLPFLRSRSLVYRAALFRTWFDERLVAWKHYVPADPRLGVGFWSTFWYLSRGFSSENPGAEAQEGLDIAKDIAEEGRSWAAKAIRSEDMQIYTFRLLLEWGRITSDNRESLWYE
ncbi:capsular associated protein [Pochonia chlamydosporia 170]|uniref:Capsular associated protein n=1 Tax=Pochonia chlamydosporia 170 TaxID=1380566 RepID=A0A179EZ61_METCM|nr:capsular associated protein [Pochonia chlamydosporia 170]OAQ58485.1 capsular associated protein [Pochonia chlamydosporia 170]